MLIKNTISLQPLSEEHAAELARLANNRKIWNNLMDYIPHPYTLKDAYEFIQLTTSETPKMTFGIIHKKQLCGVIGLVRKTDVYRLTADLGYWVGEPHWGRGMATQAIKKITTYGFKELKLHRISAYVFDFNKASMRALEKNGFEREGILRKAAIKNDQILDLHIFSKVN
jgi:ribosomal-protein-alanine N-acetyltransferase